MVLTFERTDCKGAKSSRITANVPLDSVRAVEEAFEVLRKNSPKKSGSAIVVEVLLKEAERLKGGCISRVA